MLFFQRDEVWLTCSSPSICSGRSNGSNDADIDEQVELEFHCEGVVKGQEGERERAMRRL